MHLDRTVCLLPRKSNYWYDKEIISAIIRWFSKDRTTEESLYFTSRKVNNSLTIESWRPRKH